MHLSLALEFRENSVKLSIEGTGQVEGKINQQQMYSILSPRNTRISIKKMIPSCIANIPNQTHLFQYNIICAQNRRMLLSGLVLEFQAFSLDTSNLGKYPVVVYNSFPFFQDPLIRTLQVNYSFFFLNFLQFYIIVMSQTVMGKFILHFSMAII